ncbi:chaperone modulator CbpM [Aromatoleum aromaticum]|uniref:Probable bacterial regulatory protein,MerR family n=1 Tax=Aromatoleum aromaticum (strain DSM 19018 / LMG 30748 / EbN1) TaxID=76114 RepID=Q5P4V6_AROAE|nr:chaperone modulator CbpM [Aromatoleum aromaticum]CAI07656.1 probable bacterial regulatory protein,MerR family [Aromatoleum aromaticum EbN1]
MSRQDVFTGLLLDEAALTLDELAHACGVDTQWVLERVAAGVLTCVVVTPAPRFTSRDLRRARRVRDLERAFDADPELAAIVADLVDEVERLRAQLRQTGLPAD